MTDINSIIPSPELIEQWRCEPQYVTAEQAGRYLQMVSMSYDRFVELMEKSARYGADQELEACIQYFHEYDPSWGEDSELIAGLRSTRRPKPPSLKAQALAVLDDASNRIDAAHENIIRRALEQLDD